MKTIAEEKKARAESIKILIERWVKKKTEQNKELGLSKPSKNRLSKV